MRVSRDCHLAPLLLLALHDSVDGEADLIQELLQRGSLRGEFEANQKLQLVLHITGPTPIEHRIDHERVLRAYLEIRKNLYSLFQNEKISELIGEIKQGKKPANL